MCLQIIIKGADEALVISPHQGAFMRNRQILDGVPIANELIDMKKRMRKMGLFYKLDLEKAYDHVD